MRQTIKGLFAILLLAAGLQASWGFALLGPTGNGGDSWQTATIGYNLAYGDESQQTSPGGPVFLGDIGGPKNIGEEYRRNTSKVYYAYDASFFGFFGTNGAAAADGAYAIMNNLTNVSSYSSDLSEFPLTSQHFNYTAQHFFLTDIKSVTLHLLIEQMGLADPERFTWTLAERDLLPGTSCPSGDIYLVLQRNFDISPTALSTLQYSAYVNSVLYSYFIVENCSGPNPLAYTVPFTTDPDAEEFTSVAANNGDGFGAAYFSYGGGLQVGGFYSGLTRDDVAGLRYLLRAGNINTENVAAGSLLLTTNLPPPQLLTTLSYGLFISQLTNDPATLQALYPDLQITSSTTNFALTNITFTIPTYTNFPGTTVTNFQSPSFSVLLTNYDLSLFLSLARTSSPAAMLALYPQLVILSSPVLYYTNFPTPNVSTYLTNAYGSPYPAVPVQVTVTNGYSPNIFPVYDYTFGNLVTNYYSSSNRVTIQTISVTNYTGSPYGSPVSSNATSVIKVLTNNISGDFFLIPTNWCGYKVFQKVWEQKIPSYTNVLTASGTTNTLGAAQFTQNTIMYYTNRIWAVEPGVCEPALIFTTNEVSLVLTNYQYTFGNLYTNPPTQQYTNTLVTITVTNIGVTGTNQAGTLTTNVVTTTNLIAGLPSGDFFIIPAAWTCGFAIEQVVKTNVVGTTNTVSTPVPPGVVDIGQQYSITTVSIYTNHVLLIQPYLCQLSSNAPALREGMERIQFVRANFDSLVGQYFQPITNIYTMVKVTNSQPVTEYYERIITQPDILMTADNFIGGNTFNGSVSRNIIFDTSQVLPNLAGPGVINSPVSFNYNKIGNAFRNGPILDQGATNTTLAEFTHYQTMAWASFDGSTNDPVVYPDGTSIQNLENQILVQLTPASLANGTNGVAYPATQFTATGGSFTPRFTWLASGLPAGLTMSSDGIISGTPGQTGTFNVTIQLTDSTSRKVQWNYSITIQ
ncbi:MAG: Ig domain-containing protein [Verrucomicrobiae bacterium]|nr:Ig domain-containing protein [Verrucomicrobiae bacterium]